MMSVETVETISGTINYPLVRKEARALRMLIKSVLIVLHIHCLKSEGFVNLLLSKTKTFRSLCQNIKYTSNSR